MDNNLYLDILSQGMDNVKDFSHQILGQGGLEAGQGIVISTIKGNNASLMTMGDKDSLARIVSNISGQLEPAQLLVLSRLFQNLALEQLKIK